ncbi:hypothetical protein AAFF_G00006090 [Aldrovandia affinis]|uniref:Uncharacterized protein n=1 Tax=Aldrovandia affinis TaxID=143900 RepID=A0AAD7TDY0_9TELE|nr:hypothetical protein AAFF_G00006090 [Aldrovandia affinis]
MPSRRPWLRRGRLFHSAIHRCRRVDKFKHQIPGGSSGTAPHLDRPMPPIAYCNGGVTPTFHLQRPRALLLHASEEPWLGPKNSQALTERRGAGTSVRRGWTLL